MISTRPTAKRMVRGEEEKEEEIHGELSGRESSASVVDHPSRASCPSLDRIR
jgi:hypothetical protein